MPAPTRCWCSNSTRRRDERRGVRHAAVAKLGAAGVVTGDDFSFASGRTGNVEVLNTAYSGIMTETVAPVLVGGERVSSGRVRECLVAGDIGHATHLLAIMRSRVSSSAATSAGGSLAIRRRTSSRGLPAAQVRHLRGARHAGGQGASFQALQKASASGRPSTRRRSCSRPTSSTSTATSTARGSRSRSTLTSARKALRWIEPLIAHMQEDEGRRGTCSRRD